jgi:hypothetical protein
MRDHQQGEAMDTMLIKSDTTRKAGGLMSGVASKAITLVN